jgi:O-acetyl-ADP-ribose deacetylase (regulator of RNase III)
MARIHYQKGDIFNSTSQVIVNTVNCKGVMGKGLALSFKQRYPDMFQVYQQECKSGKIRIGRPSLYKGSTPWILNFPTKDHWKPPSKIEYLQKGLEYFVANYKKADITSIAFPKLGAQNGKLSWDEVGPLMAEYLSPLDIVVYIYIAEGDKEYQYDEQQEQANWEKIWQQFNAIALTQDSLIDEVSLSKRDAKRVAEKRASVEFSCIADIESIEKLGKTTSLPKIKSYLEQEYSFVALYGTLPTRIVPSPTKKKLDEHRQDDRKKADRSHVDLTAEELFPVRSAHWSLAKKGQVC